MSEGTQIASPVRIHTGLDNPTTLREKVRSAGARRKKRGWEEETRDRTRQIGNRLKQLRYEDRDGNVHNKTREAGE